MLQSSQCDRAVIYIVLSFTHAHTNTHTHTGSDLINPVVPRDEEKPSVTRSKNPSVNYKYFICQTARVTSQRY